MASTTAARAAATESGCSRSMAKAWARPPAASISPAVCSAPATSRSATATAKPRCAIARQVSSPMPDAPPVTTASGVVIDVRRAGP